MTPRNAGITWHILILLTGFPAIGYGQDVLGAADPCASSSSLEPREETHLKFGRLALTLALARDYQRVDTASGSDATPLFRPTNPASGATIALAIVPSIVQSEVTYIDGVPVSPRAQSSRRCSHPVEGVLTSTAVNSFGGRNYTVTLRIPLSVDSTLQVTGTAWDPSEQATQLAMLQSLTLDEYQQ